MDSISPRQSYSSNQQPLPPLQAHLSSSRKTNIQQDGFAWVKYGEKKLTPSKIIREYYRCKSWRDPNAGGTGCPAKKVVDRPYFTDDEGEHGEKKRARAVFPRHSPCQSPEYSQHNHPPLVPPSPCAYESPITPPTPCPLPLSPIWDHKCTGPSQHSAPSFSPSLSTFSSPDTLLTSCIGTLAASTLTASVQAHAPSSPVKAESVFDNCLSTGRRKRPSLRPLLIPEILPHSAPVEPSANRTPERTVCSSPADFTTTAVGQHHASSAAIFSAVATLLLNQHEESKRSQAAAQKASLMLLQQMLGQASGAPSRKRQRTMLPAGDGLPALPASPFSGQLSDFHTTPSPQRINSDGNIPSGSTATSSGALSSGGVIAPASPSATQSSGMTTSNCSMTLSDLSDDALLSLLNFLSGQIAGSLDAATPS